MSKKTFKNFKKQEKIFKKIRKKIEILRFPFPKQIFENSSVLNDEKPIDHPQQKPEGKEIVLLKCSMI